MEKTDLKTQLAEVAERIRTMREITGLSEGEMAKCTGVPLEEYQQCEAGEKDFSFTFIYKCAQRFGIDPTDLIKGVSPTLSSYTVNRKGDGLPITRRQGFKYLNMAPLFKNKTAEPFFVTMPYEEAQQKVAIKLSTHVGQELDIILKGAMKVQVGNHIEVLHEGDSIYYNSATPHGMIATEGAECQFYAIVMKGAEEFAPEQDRFQRLIDQKLARQDRETVSTPFVKTELDENGILKSIRFENEEKFNFAFDIVDKLAEKSPDKLAMLHVSRDKVERRFTFGDISRWSAKTANYLESLGIQRGDRVMVVLKRHYQFWFVITALHKMGAVIIPATNLLMEHDFDYRFKAAGVKAILCTADGQVADEAEQAALDLFYHRALDKRYVARCVGKPVPPGVYEAYLYKDAQAAHVHILDRPRPGAAPIRTGIDVLEDGPYPLLELALLTGRTHQLRAHLAHLGLPILGDDKYGDRSANKSAGLRHPCLWAVSLAFPEDLPTPLTGLAGRRLVSAPRFPNR